MTLLSCGDIEAKPGPGVTRAVQCSMDEPRGASYGLRSLEVDDITRPTEGGAGGEGDAPAPQEGQRSHGTRLYEAWAASLMASASTDDLDESPAPRRIVRGLYIPAVYIFFPLCK